MLDEAQSRTLKRTGLVAAFTAAAIVAVGVSTRISAGHELATAARENAVPIVTVVQPKRGASTAELQLPGNVQAFNSAPIFARTNGYVRRWLVDIGDSVAAGQTLAILDAPEVDQQLAQAQADYQTALANQKLARTTAERWQTLLRKDAVSRQEADEKAGDYAAKTAVANAQLANVSRLRAVQGFERLTAPFSGIVTSRSAQIGALVTSGNASAQPLFTVSDVRRLRIYVRVPQSFSAQVHPGLGVTLTVPEYPGRTFNAVLVRTAGAVDPQSGTVLVELQADNSDRALKPGAYATVTFPLPAAANALRLPGSAILFRESGPTVVIVDKSGRARLQTVQIGRDQGKEVEIVAGLKGDERVVDTPPDAIETGDQLKVEARARG
ncbi:efflux RND transporter periplasmic adaptor subunit [Sphingomonas sp. MAH-20]|uniref:Efflux RND transporter periplasmic adaptor subunit n=1 Tax=Sphingomonas horti TaxID=2682842 RepID=A0A6I4IWU9_9SPHN|nr:MULTISPECIES: efflux RND transporter periplasmic adaptor subunit [Sphingomonas]MBA2920193.1 efflux RND transporter periplasmic adaptor subunit [Sphingomonas sp. CGMCC 1.13658]MVO76448.1 efflux RND transporter periplasmic adaptor subunit [Sphingomonas horti]